MSQFPQAKSSSRQSAGSLSITHSFGVDIKSYFSSGGNFTSTANVVLLIPFIVYTEMTVRQFLIREGTVAGATTWDLGIYDSEGHLLGSTGAKASGGTNTVVAHNAIAPFVLKPGFYYLAFCGDGGTGTFNGFAPLAGLGGFQASRAVGIRQHTSGSVPLPATVTFAALAQANFPSFGVSQNTAALS
jgi:hypothetical protein